MNEGSSDFAEPKEEEEKSARVTRLSNVPVVELLSLRPGQPILIELHDEPLTFTAYTIADGELTFLAYDRAGYPVKFTLADIPSKHLSQLSEKNPAAFRELSLMVGRLDYRQRLAALD